MRIIYISKAIPPNELSEASTSRIIENNMACGVAEMLNYQYKDKLKCYSMQPRVKEKGYYKVAKRRKAKLPCGIETEVLLGITTPILSVAIGFFSLIKVLRKEVLQSINNGEDNIVIVTYNAGAPSSVAINFLPNKIKIKRIAVLFDAPVIVLNSTPTKNLILRLWNTMAKYFFNKYDAAITVAEKCVTDFSDDMEYLQILMGTQSNMLKLKFDKIKLEKEIIIGYAGNLAKHNGLILLIESMKYLPPNYRLVIMGNGKLERYVIEKSNIDPRIIFKGLLDTNEVLKEYNKCNILTIIRCGGDRVSDYLLKYGTSSKLSELMLTGKPVITSEIEANPKQFNEFLNVVDDLTPETVALKIRDITKSDSEYEKYCEKAASGRKYYMEKGTWKYQSKQVYEFIASIVK